MAFPIGTDASEHGSAPVVTYFLIIANVLVFLVERSQGEAFVRHWAFIPRQFFADPHFSRRQSYQRVTVSGSRANPSGDASSWGSNFAHNPSMASRKVGMPLSADTPAPVNTTTARADRSAAAKALGMTNGLCTVPICRKSRNGFATRLSGRTAASAPPRRC